MKYLVYILLCGPLLLHAQEGQFSQYFASSALLNPAFAGTIPALTLNSGYKRGGNPSSESYIELMQTTITYPFRKTTSKDTQIGGAGISFFREKRGFQGVYTSQKILLTGAYTMKLARLSNQHLVFGLQGGMVQHEIDGSNLTWGSQFNRYIGFDNTLPPEAVGSDPIFYPVFNFGIMYTVFDNQNLYVRDKSLTIGLSADNLNRPSLSYTGAEDERKSPLFKAFGTAKLAIAPRLYMFPSTYLLYSQGSKQINAGLYFSMFVSSVKAKNAVLLQLGSWYRVGDSLISMIGIQLDNLRAGVSADLNSQTRDLTEETGNQLPTYEITLTYNLNLSGPLRNISSPIF